MHIILISPHAQGMLIQHYYTLVCFLFLVSCLFLGVEQLGIAAESPIAFAEHTSLCGVKRKTWLGIMDEQDRQHGVCMGCA